MVLLLAVLLVKLSRRISSCKIDIDTRTYMLGNQTQLLRMMYDDSLLKLTCPRVTFFAHLHRCQSGADVSKLTFTFSDMGNFAVVVDVGDSG